MYTRFERMGLFSLLLVLLSILSQAKEKDRLPELQKAVGKDWVVTALPDGYLVTYVPLVNFYPAVSESSKLDYHQRAAHGRMDHLRIKITYLYPPSIKKVDQYNAFWLKVQKGSPGFFGCGNEDWCIEYDHPSWNIQDRLANGQSLIGFSSNLAPDRLIPSSVQEEVYERTLDNLATIFHYIRHHEPWIED